MTRVASLAALLVAASCINTVQADVTPAAEPEVIVATEPEPAEPIVESKPCKKHGGLGKWLFGNRYHHPSNARPFIVGNTRYEPRLRDIRLLRHPTTLPGNDAGIPETLPVLPFYADGYFQLPVR